MVTDKLPINKKVKKINKSAFVSLANKVREILKKEDRLLKREETSRGIDSASRSNSFS